MEKVIVVIGPTSVGKTKMGVALAKKFNGEVISGDSMQIYKQMDIGTAKVTEEEKEGIIHHCVDILNSDETYSVHDFQQTVRKKITEITQRGHVPIIVGGTGLYIKAALYDYRFKQEDELDDYHDLTNQELLDNIKKYDINCSIHINNRKRLIRLLNKYEKNLVEEKTGNNPLYSFLLIGLTTNRNILYEKINLRVDKMVSEGLIEEAKALYDQKVNTKAIQTAIGYKELYLYFDHKCSLEESLELIKKNSRHYAKRQYTFFKHQFDHIKWLTTNYQDFNKTVTDAINYIEGDENDRRIN